MKIPFLIGFISSGYFGFSLQAQALNLSVAESTIEKPSPSPHGASPPTAAAKPSFFAITKQLTSDEASFIERWNTEQLRRELSYSTSVNDNEIRSREDRDEDTDSIEELRHPSPKFRVARPFNDFDEVRTLIFAGHNYWSEARTAKAKIIEGLPEGVNVLVYDSNDSEEAGLRDLPFYRAINSMIQITRELFRVPGIGFWSRDVIPVPVYLQDGRLAAVDAKYYRDFEPDAEVGRYFGIPIVQHKYIFEGGNFLSDADGNCFIVNNNRGSSKIPDRIFLEIYGCANLVRFPMFGGIGHIDERLKIFPNKVAMIDTPQYRQRLEALGYRVIEIPRGKRPYETYINSILINGVAFVPIFNQDQDSVVVNAYSKLGYRVVPIYTYDLPNDGLGSLHCITMTYPEKL